jgi:hypothetical protein
MPVTKTAHLIYFINSAHNAWVLSDETLAVQMLQGPNMYLNNTWGILFITTSENQTILLPLTPNKVHLINKQKSGQKGVNPSGYTNKLS